MKLDNVTTGTTITTTSTTIDRKLYEDDLKRRQQEHLDNITNNRLNTFWQPCMHDSCPECIGTGVRRDGSMCVHMISCNCPKCTPIC